MLILIDSMLKDSEVDFSGDGRCDKEDLFLFSIQWGK